jgi:hypothetical protein
MLTTVSFQPIHIGSSVDYAAEAREEPAETPANASAQVPSEIPAAPSLPPWLEPSNFDFLRRVAQAISARSDR